MKSFLLMLVVIVSAVAEGQTVNPAQMKNFGFMGAQFQGNGSSLQVIGGTVMVSPTLIDLSMQFRPVCAPNAPCLDVVAVPHMTRMPVVAVQPSLCGDRFIAQVDRSAIDGVAERIEIIDYSRAACEIHLPSIARGTYTRVSLDRRTGQRVVHTYHFNLNSTNQVAFGR